MERIDLNKQVFDKTQFSNTINTAFTQLTGSSSTPVAPVVTVDQFFQYYQELFYQIPKFGLINSHEYLIQTSGEYVGEEQLNSTIQALIDEITQLREENLSLQQSIINTSLSGSNTALNNANSTNV